MDSSRFDQLTRAFSGITRRHGLLGVLALLTAVLADMASDADESAARRRRRGRRRSHRPGNDKDNRKGKRKKKRQRQRRRRRRRRGTGAPDDRCGTCPEGQTCCTGMCVDLKTDNFNCGTCSNVCPVPSLRCVDGTCACPNQICANECCPNAHEVCNQITGECCAPKTCDDFPPGTCGPQDDGCGGTAKCPCCPGTPCSCPAGRTLCDNLVPPEVLCTGSTCGCATHAQDGQSVCYGTSGGACRRHGRICSSDEDCEDQDYPGTHCVLTGDCGLDCFETACVAVCSPDSPGGPLQIDILP